MDLEVQLLAPASETVGPNSPNQYKYDSVQPY